MVRRADENSRLRRLDLVSVGIGLLGCLCRDLRRLLVSLPIVSLLWVTMSCKLCPTQSAQSVR
jgi:hypothetical protein